VINGSSQSKLTQQNMQNLQATFLMAQEMVEGLERSQVLQ